MSQPISVPIAHFLILNLSQWRKHGIKLKVNCKECNIELELNSDNFFRESKSKTGFRKKCKECDMNIHVSKKYRDSYLKGKSHFLLQLGIHKEYIPETITNDTEIEYYCNSGHRNVKSFKNIKNRGLTCLDCNRLKPYYEIKDILESEGYTILTSEDEFEGAGKGNIYYICPVGHYHNSYCSSIRTGYRCRYCGIIKCSDSNRTNEDEVLSYIKSINYEFLDLIGENFKISNRIFLKCDKGHEYDTMISTLLSGHKCRKCFFINNSRDGNYNWNGGLSELKNYLRGTINEWKRDSILNAEYTCFITGLKGKLHVHHPINFSTIIREILNYLNLPLLPVVGDYSNEELDSIVNEVVKKHYEYGLGIVLLKEIHTFFHSTYGIKDNNMEQVLEFKQDYLNGKYDDVLPENLKSTTTQPTKNH